MGFLWQTSGVGNEWIGVHIQRMENSSRYQVQVGGFLTEGFDAASDANADSVIARICTGRESISKLPPDTEITITAPDGTVRTTTLEQSKRF